MLESATAQVRSWIDNGIEESSIAVAARTKGNFSTMESLLRAEGIATHRLGRDLNAGNGVALGTMHRMKGLEYRAVAVVGASEGTLPFAPDVTALAEDPVQHELDLKRERCLLYVACTRAREDLWVGWSGHPSEFLEPDGA